MTDRELMQQALEALVLAQKDAQIAEADYAITALRERLAQPEQEPVRLQCTTCGTVYADGVPPQVPEQEPVAWLYRDSWGTMKLSQIMPPPVGAFPVYTTPPRREWVGLTEEEVDECYYWKGRQWTTDELVRHVEAKLKEKNA